MAAGGARAEFGRAGRGGSTRGWRDPGGGKGKKAVRGEGARGAAPARRAASRAGQRRGLPPSRRCAAVSRSRVRLHLCAFRPAAASDGRVRISGRRGSGGRPKGSGGIERGIGVPTPLRSADRFLVFARHVGSAIWPHGRRARPRRRSSCVYTIRNAVRKAQRQGGPLDHEHAGLARRALSGSRVGG